MIIANIKDRNNNNKNNKKKKKIPDFAQHFDLLTIFDSGIIGINELALHELYT